MLPFRSLETSRRARTAERSLSFLVPGSLVAADTGQVIREFSGATDSAAVAAFFGNGDLVALGGKDPLIGVWDLDTGSFATR